MGVDDIPLFTQAVYLDFTLFVESRSGIQASVVRRQTPPLANPRLVGGIQESDYLGAFCNRTYICYEKLI